MKFATAVGCFLAISSPHGSDADAGVRTTYTGSLFGFGGRRGLLTGPVPENYKRKLATKKRGSNVGCELSAGSVRSARRKLLEGVADDGSTNYFFMKANNFTDEYCNTEAGCAVAMSLIKSPECNTAEAYGAASTFSVDPELSYSTTNEDGSNDGWMTTPFHEVANSNSTPLSLGEFVTADSSAAGSDYHLAVYLYNNESKPVACATLSEVTDEEEVKYYDNLVASDTADNESPVGDTAGGGFVMTSACVIGVSFLLSAINFIAA